MQAETFPQRPFNNIYAFHLDGLMDSSWEVVGRGAAERGGGVVVARTAGLRRAGVGTRRETGACAVRDCLSGWDV